MISFQHSKLFAYELNRRRGSDEDDQFAGALVDAQVDVNPHQVDAALFAVQNPISGGALLADEVGLGKTIEAGLVISQKWAEHRRRILIVVPANLRKQWQVELTEKFFLPVEIIESASFNAAMKRGTANPFMTDRILICSYQFAARRALEVQAVPWDLVVLDEAHRLRNVYKSGSKVAGTLKTALSGSPKLLLTATPLQNSLLELYGLVSLLDDKVFGDLQSFREQYSNLSNPATFQNLKNRLQPFCHRTLRKQVTQYVNYTRRHVLVEEFTPHHGEQRLYEQVSEFLQREHLAALPNSQRNLITLILRKLLASSSFAIAGALGTIHARVQQELRNLPASGSVDDDLSSDYDAYAETADEWEDTPEPLNAKAREQLGEEAVELERLYTAAQDIRQNAKGEALLSGLRRAFTEAERGGAPRKAIIFTESRRTQDYLLGLLEDHGYEGRIVLFNGTNTDERSRATYQQWLKRHQGTDRISGSRTADMRSALVDEFRDHAEIMIATEAGAEGINLQFCALVVNYDLPWNPQRIEQRIGRCHRYGQKHDVVVLNFLNKGNEADQRVYELLSEKFKLFEGVFGSSDEVIGALSSGVDFEKRVADIYQKCRTPADIKAAFDTLQQSLNTEIAAAMTRTRAQLLENFDEEVHRVLKQRQEKSSEQLDQFSRWLMALTRAELGPDAQFTPGSERTFTLLNDPAGLGLPLGTYTLPRRDPQLRDLPDQTSTHRYRLGHPLAQHLITQAQKRSLPTEHLTFQYDGTTEHIGALRHMRGQSGWLGAALYRVEALGQTEEHLLLSALTDDGEILAPDIARKFFRLSATPSPTHLPPPTELTTLLDNAQQQKREAINTRNLKTFEDAAQRIDAWSEDLKVGLERDIKTLDVEIKQARRTATVAATLQAKLDAQKHVQELEKERTRKRRTLFDEQDRIDEKRQELINQLAEKLEEHENLTPLFTIQWSLI
ncbi:adenine-specific DNA-methyltransferase [Deinococcus reticulitermitis]|uniref:Adenine-specific DNA-methyltransferase n=1 Tax=Deinococcus reticulitermitis TaxID=856736 RepID=A0A1H6V0Z2_9DEIO|nr:SNF2-related protein [Deinococcus reticulitermitis]SEI98239.1 adenine-specific DNA-methyltransferase [Deinococcus reticulitermitis]